MAHDPHDPVAQDRLQGPLLQSVLIAALELGYRHIDTAQVYRNEEDIGAVLKTVLHGPTTTTTAATTTTSTTSITANNKASGDVATDLRLTREDLFITSKISPRNAGSKAYTSVLDSIKKLNVEYIDLMLIHWPGSSGLSLTSPKNAANRQTTWSALEQLKSEGLVREIGVSNFTVKHLRELLEGAVVKPAKRVGPFLRGDGYRGASLLITW